MHYSTVFIKSGLGVSFTVLAVFCCLAGCGLIRNRPDHGTLPNGKLETRIVRVQAYAGVEPRNLPVRPGTVVVWLNQYADDIRIIFPDQKVTIACLSPVNFRSNEGFFESSRLHHGAVASLCFVQPGSYAYRIERLPSARRAMSEGFRFEGVITVR